MNRLRTFLNRHFAQFGIAGASVITLALLLPQVSFENREGQPYSMMNHFVSELGWLGVSDKAIIFNLGLVLGGLCFAVFMFGLGRQFPGFWGWCVSLLGALAAIFASLVGVFPVVDHWLGLAAHLLAAGALGTAAFWTAVAIVFMVWLNKDVVPKPFALLGVLVLLSFASGVTIHPGEHVFPFFDPDTKQIVNRPDHWQLPIVEWLIVWTVVGALFLASVYFEVRRLVRLAPPNEPE